MNKEKFTEIVTEGVLLQLGESWVIQHHPVYKINEKKIATNFIKKGKEDGPHLTIYLDELYEAYKNGEDITYIIKNIENHIRNAKCPEVLDETFFKRAKENLFPVVINYELNKDFLKEIPHKRFLDLAIIIKADMGASEGFTTITINKSAMVNCEIKDEKDLFDLAQLKRMYGKPMFPFLKNAGFACSNEQNLYGASSLLLNNAAMEELADGYFDDDLYIIPMSIHECLALPKSFYSLDAVSEIMKDASREIFETKYFLSQSIYLYERNTGELRIARR